MKKLYLSILISLAAYNLSFAQCSANFQASKNPICVGEEVYFTNLSTSAGVVTVPPTTYLWGFGGGTQSVGKTLLDEDAGNITYAGPAGIKTVSLSVSCVVNASLCTATNFALPPLVFQTTVCVPVIGGGGGVLMTSTRTQSFTVKEVPAPTFTPSTLAPCAGDEVNFSYTGSADVANTFSWNFGAGASPSTSNVENPTGIVYSTEGTKNVTLTVSNGACESSSPVTIITVSPGPTASILSSAPACVNETVAFASGGNADTWTWNFGTGATPATDNVENPTAVYSTSGAKTITLTTGLTGCTNTPTATAAIIIYESPTSAFTIAPAPACTGETVDFTNTGSTGGNWRYLWDFGAGASPFSSSAENPTGIVYATDGSKTITLTVFDNHCSATTTNSLTINLSPTASFSSTEPACTKTPVDFFNTGTEGAASYAWNFGGNATPATGNTEDVLGVSFALAGAETVTLTTTSANGCTDTYTDRITIFQSPIATFDAPGSVCVNTPFNISNTGSSGASIDTNWVYVWDFGAGAISHAATSENPGGIYYTTPGIKTITLTVSNENCSTTLTKTVTVNATPVAKFTATEPQCTGLPVNFNNMGIFDAGATFAWNFDVGSTEAAALTNTTDENPTDIIYDVAGNKIVEQIITNTNSCSDTTTQAVLIRLTPTVTFTSNAPKCAGDSVRFTNGGSTGSTGTTTAEYAYSWDFGQDALPQTSTAENPAGVAYSTGGTKIVTLRISNGNCTETNTQTIVINALPVVNAGRDTTICANTTTQIGSTSIGENSYSWFAPSTLNNAAIADPVATPVAHITEYIVTVTGPTPNFCVNMDTITVTMLDPIDVFAGVDEEICRFDSVQIGVGLVEQQLYTWTPIAGLSDPTLPNPVASPDSTTTYQVSVLFDGKSCIAETDEVTITVHQLPYIKAGTINKQPSPTDTIVIVDSMTVGATIQLIAIGGLQYTWDPAYSLDNVGIFNPYATPDSTTSYEVTGIDIYGCINTDSVTIIVLVPSFWAPTGFTPNDDGENDVFFIRGPGIEDFELGIFNRWGEQIFKSNSIEQGWDGTRPITGEKLPAGAYVYYIKGTLTDGTPVDTKALINLIR